MPRFFCFTGWHIIVGSTAMKCMCPFLIIFSTWIQTFSQVPPANDTLIPKQQQDDTVLYEPKLQGGALIDTINIKSKPDYRPGYLKDTLKEKNSWEKPKGKHD